MQSQLKDLESRGLGVAAISYDSPEIISAFAKQRNITFPVLSDAGSATIRLYGLVNPVAEMAFGPLKDDPGVKEEIRKYVSEVGVNRNMIGMAFPGTFLLDRKGRVTARFFEDFYIERNTVSSLMVRLGNGGSGKTAAPVAATKVSGAHLDLTTYPSDSSIAAGNRIALILDITPGPGIHVYAPGAKSYKPVALTIAPQDNIRALPAQYPPSQIYFFRPLKERVPVYEKPFRLVQEIVLEGSLKAQATYRGKPNLTVNGMFDYQACDSKECFNPVSIPLTWTLDLRPTIFQRPAGSVASGPAAPGPGR